MQCQMSQIQGEFAACVAALIVRTFSTAIQGLQARCRAGRTLGTSGSTGSEAERGCTQGSICCSATLSAEVVARSTLRLCTRTGTAATVICTSSTNQ